MKKAIIISFILILGCSDGPDIIPCFIGTPLTDTVCIEISEPVCGCNGITYDNECYAEKSGVSNWIEGKCLD
jgi:hypothetical protein